MPYTCKKKDCKQSDGSSGSYVMVKDATGEEVSCHTSKADCEAAVRAINASENSIDPTMTKRIKDIIEKYRNLLKRL